MKLSPGVFWERTAPAKINLMLAITGVRADGFHNLVSLVMPLPSLCDNLRMEILPDANGDELICDAPGVPVDGSNLVLRAAAAFRELVPAFPPVRFFLEKNIPHGAGLGGGSSDAATALLLMADAAGMSAPSLDALSGIAAKVGSDCPLFLAGDPIVMRGRGEQVENLSAEEKANLFSRSFLIFKPAFGVSTAEAYGAMKRSAPKFYTPEAEAERRLAAWRNAPDTEPLPLFNDMEAPVFEKHVALPALFSVLRERFGLAPHMSGSGSACFAEITPNLDLDAVRACIVDCWGPSAFFGIAGNGFDKK